MKLQRRSVLAFFSKPHYYKYASREIQCHCPLCKCPASGGLRYSFVFSCERRKLIYYGIPKCASTTIRMELFENDYNHSLRNPTQDLDQYFKFTFVRNPWDRMVSNWKMFTSRPSRQRQLASMTDKDVSRFSDFVSFAEVAKNHHWQPQVRYLPDTVDFVGRVETLDDDFRHVCKAVGETTARPSRKNATRRARYQEYYTPELVERVGAMFAEDIDQFSYRFEA